MSRPTTTDASTPCPLPALLAFSAASNFAAGIATVGIFFLTESAYGYTTTENYLLALLVGGSYALSAWKAGPLVRAMARPGGTSSRGALALMSVALAGLCTLPWLVRERWIPFLFIALYTPITGAFWPLVESYLSGGRRGEALRRALGTFNLTWSTGMSLAFLVVAPLVPGYPLEVLLALAVIHLACLVALPFFGRDPARHLEEAHRPPESYRALLAGHRILLVASYLVMFALSPYLPALMVELEVPAGLRVALGSLWMPVRMASFWLFGRWHGWHGKPWIGAWGGVLLFVSFGTIVLAPELGGRAAAIAALVAGQLAFGLAMAALYTANLYYTLEVGEAAVDAGGSHEGLIGLGYTLGPLCGASASGMAALGWITDGAAEALVIVLIEAQVAGAAIWAWRATRRGPGSGTAGLARPDEVNA